MRFASFFAGVGGFDLGFQQAGLTPVFHCEIDPYCQRVLKRHWPDVPLHGDINTLDPKGVPNAELWCAGWPCQDLSHANAQREGLDGRRSGLFFALTQLASIRKPRWLVLENVSGLLSADKGRDFERVINELEEIGYLGIWFSCNLLSFGIPQNRERVFLIASYRSELSYKFYTDSSKLLGDHKARKASGPWGEARSELPEGIVSDNPLLVQRRGGFGYTKATGFSPTLRAQTGRHQGGHTDRPIVCGQKFDVERVRETNGIPRGLDGRRGRFIGNAVAPPIARFIGTRILEIERRMQSDEQLDDSAMDRLDRLGIGDLIRGT